MGILQQDTQSFIVNVRLPVRFYAEFRVGKRSRHPSVLGWYTNEADLFIPAVNEAAKIVVISMILSNVNSVLCGFVPSFYRKNNVFYNLQVYLEYSRSKR